MRSIVLSLFILGLTILFVASACATSTLSQSPTRYVEPNYGATTLQEQRDATQAVDFAADTALAQENDYVGLYSCISWKEAFAHIGEQTCVTGIVTSTYNSGRAFFINFTSNRTAFYAVSFDYIWDDLQGSCVIVEGEIVRYENRPEIIIRDPNQLKSCRQVR